MTNHLNAAFFALVCLSAWCCAQPPPPLVAFADLTLAARWGDVETATRRLDFDAETKFRLVSGWARPEVDSRGTTFVWAVGQKSELTWTVVEPRDLELVLSGWPFQYQGAPAQEVRVEVGGVTVDSFEMNAGLGEYRVSVSAEHWRPGDNAIRLVHSRATVPADVSSSDDPRELAAAWTEVRVADLAEQADTDSVPTSPTVDQDRIFLPWDSRLGLFVDPPVEVFLDPGRLSFRGSGQLRIEVAVDSDQGANSPNVVAELRNESPNGLISLAHSAEERGPMRISLVAIPDAGAAAGGIVMQAPRLMATARSAESRNARPDPVVAKPAELPVPDLFVLYVVDTLRADHLAAWAGAEGTPESKPPVPTPNLDAFAAKSVVFRRVMAQSPWTKASLASILTGRWPPEHGAIDRNDRLPADLPVLAEILRRAGWHTEAVVTNPNVIEVFGFDRGFDHFEYLSENSTAEGVNDWVAQRLDDLGASANPPERPFERLFLYAHVIDPHSPYNPPAAWRERLAPDAPADFAHESLQKLNDFHHGRIPMTPEILRRLHDLYRAEIAYADDAFGRFLDLLASRGYRDPAILYVSDHGEEFLEHGNLEHGRALHAESLWVPMALRWPGLEPAVIDRPVQHLDVLPTLLPRLAALPADIEAAASLAGVDLLEAEPAGVGSRALFSHLHLDGPERVAIVVDGFKVIVDFGSACDSTTGRRAERFWQLYDTQSDPGEQRNLAAELPIRLGFLRFLLRQQLGPCGGDPAFGHDVDLDDETRRSLEALGYL